MTTLFDLPESKSPRLLWMEKHALQTHYFKDAELGKEWMAGIANNGRINDESSFIGFGLTEDEALANLAIALGVKLWNEE